MDTLPFNWTFGAGTDRVWSVEDRREEPLDPFFSRPGGSTASDARPDESSMALGRRSRPREAWWARGTRAVERHQCRGAAARCGRRRLGAL